MINYFVAFGNTDGSAYPGTAAVNATGPGATDGTEFIALMVDDIWGRSQAIMDYAGLIPDGVSEAAGTAQIIEALQKGFGAPPGVSTEWNLADDPAVSGHRALFLQGQGILRANYPDLDAAVYVGDANNAAVAAGGGAFFRADNSDGSSPNTAGAYLILPESRGVVSRGLDSAATIDPLGASRFLGDLQQDASQGHWHNLQSTLGADNLYVDPAGTGAAADGNTVSAGGGASQPRIETTDPIIGSHGAVRTSTETRMYNRSTHFVIWY